jgi:ParB-like chromosome segregation protein Spo0J
MRVIDGMHRVRACQLNGVPTIQARLIDDDDDLAFLRAVSINVRHGLPLTTQDRRMAATRLLHMFPHYSDRALSRASGLSDKTIASLRRTANHGSDTRRTGLDGRVRPARRQDLQHAVCELLERRPSASLRTIAETVGVSPNTVRRIRQRANGTTAGRPAGPLTQAGHRVARASAAQPSELDQLTLLTNLSRDPSLRYNETGRNLLRTLHQHMNAPLDGQAVSALPPHSLPSVARIARTFARQWEQLATVIEHRAHAENV